MSDFSGLSVAQLSALADESVAFLDVAIPAGLAKCAELKSEVCYVSAATSANNFVEVNDEPKRYGQSSAT